MKTEIRNFSYEYRNKLLAKACLGLLVLGAGEKSGALITAKYAREYQKEIFALPYPPSSAVGVGCNGLIKRGAHLTETAQDVLSYYGLEESVKAQEIVLTNDEEKVLDTLKENGETHVAELAKETGIPVYRLSGVLSALEMKGLAVRLGGNIYSAV